MNPIDALNNRIDDLEKEVARLRFLVLLNMKSWGSSAWSDVNQDHVRWKEKREEENEAT